MEDKEKKLALQKAVGERVYHSRKLARMSKEELAERRKTWVCPPPRIQSGYLKRYARSVSSADRGAILL